MTHKIAVDKSNILFLAVDIQEALSKRKTEIKKERNKERKKERRSDLKSHLNSSLKCEK